MAPDGQKRILTNIETIAQLAALVPRALNDVYRGRPSFAGQQSAPASLPSSSTPPKPLHSVIRLSLTQYLHRQKVELSATTQGSQCPCLFTFLLSPSLLGTICGYPELGSLCSSASSDPSLYVCTHCLHGFFSYPLSNSPAGRLKDSLADRTRFAECTLSNIFWNLVKTARLIDDGQYSQAYINLGITITKAFRLQLHRQQTSHVQVTSANELEREVLTRLFWLVWLMDTQITLLHGGRPSIQLSDIEIDKPRFHSSTILTTVEDREHTECLKWLVEVRWIRARMEENLMTLEDEEDPSKRLNTLVQQMRQLRRFYERLDDHLKLDRLLLSAVKAEDSCWRHRTVHLLHLEHGLNWLILFERFLPELPDDGFASLSKFPENLAVVMCRQAADLMTLVYEQWLWDRYDCQSRLYLCHFINTVAIHKVKLDMVYLRKKRKGTVIH